MEDFTRTGNDFTWITNEIVQITPFHAANGVPTACMNILAPRCIVFSNVCDCYLIMTLDDHRYNGQCYATNVAFNVLNRFIFTLLNFESKRRT
jgi:hypothetical protein